MCASGLASLFYWRAGAGSGARRSDWCESFPNLAPGVVNEPSAIVDGNVDIDLIHKIAVRILPRFHPEAQDPRWGA